MNLQTSPVRKLAILLALGAAIPQLSFALSSFTWNGAANSTWDTTSANWTGSTTNWINGTGTNANDAVFSTGTTVTLGSTPISVHYINSTGNTFINSGTLVLDSGTTTAASGTAGPTLNAGGGTLTVSSVLTGTRGFVTNGGTVVVSSTATYTGITLINNGILKLGGNNVLPTTSNLAIFGGGRTLELNGFSQTVANIQGSNGIIKNSTGTSTFTISGTTSTASTGIQLTGTLNFAYANSGTLGLTASNGALNYTGSTTLSAGTLILSSSGTSLGTATFANIVNSSLVTINGSTLTSSGTWTNNFNLGAGNVVMSAGTISPGTSGTSGTLYSFTVAANKNFITTGGTIRLDLDTTSSLDQIIGSGSGTFSLTNTTLALGLVTWSGTDYNNTYDVFSGFNSGSVSGLTITGYDTVNYLASLNNSGVLSFAAVPEPATIALGGMGLALAILQRRRREMNS